MKSTFHLVENLDIIYVLEFVHLNPKRVIFVQNGSTSTPRYELNRLMKSCSIN